MKTNKFTAGIIKLVLLTVMAGSISAKASAQNVTGQKLKDMTPGQRASFQTGMMKSKLKLDTQQLAKVSSLNLKYALKFEPIIKSNDGRITKYRQAMALQNQKDNELKGVFTTEQFKQYKNFESDMRSKIMAGAGQ